MKFARMTSKGRAAIPKSVRDARGLEADDLLSVTVENEGIVLRKLAALGATYRGSLESALEEWRSATDESAFANL